MHEDSTPPKHAGLWIRSRTSDDLGKPPKTGATPGWWTGKHAGSITNRSDSMGSGPSVPEPSALLVFGVGFLIARRALSRARS